MRFDSLNQYQHVVAIGGGHGLGRVLASLSFLGQKLTGIVATTDNGGSTGRLRQDQNCIAWGDLRNCLTQLAPRPSIGSLLFDYRFSGDNELSGHNLGNIILLAMDQLCVRPLEAIHLIRHMLKIDTRLLPMSEQPTHLLATQSDGSQVMGEMNVDNMPTMPSTLTLSPMVMPTLEACEAIKHAELIILGPGSFLTSTLPALLLPDIAQAIAVSRATIVFIDNLTAEHSPAASLTLDEKVKWCETLIGVPKAIKVIRHGAMQDVHQLDSDPQAPRGTSHQTFFYPLESEYSPGLHDKLALATAIDLVCGDARELQAKADA